ncbi:uncharacterized protein IWZ02DRAFT_296911 [Phyllosticta citriasiana]|uniref:uncharacterized protein n=1 Tax=Phyllosticta citriasiana TaxID=595635 RepID=UPI0030FDA652
MSCVAASFSSSLFRGLGPLRRRHTMPKGVFRTPDAKDVGQAKPHHLTTPPNKAQTDDTPGQEQMHSTRTGFCFFCSSNSRVEQWVDSSLANRFSCFSFFSGRSNTSLRRRKSPSIPTTRFTPPWVVDRLTAHCMLSSHCGVLMVVVAVVAQPHVWHHHGPHASSIQQASRKTKKPTLNNPPSLLLELTGRPERRETHRAMTILFFRSIPRQPARAAPR